MRVGRHSAAAQISRHRRMCHQRGGAWTRWQITLPGGTGRILLATGGLSTTSFDLSQTEFSLLPVGRLVSFRSNGGEPVPQPPQLPFRHFNHSRIRMKVLVVGGGGREHALAWKISQSDRVTQVFVAPGNAGTAKDATNVPISATDPSALIEFAKKEAIDLIVVGPEAPLVDGLVDQMEAEGLRVFGPSKAAAELEGSKVFCKDLLRSADIPTANYQTFRSGEDAIRYIKDRYDDPGEPVHVVVKADGLAAGKGVIVCSTRGDALDAIDRIASRREFGEAGNELIIEEKLIGQEASVLAITDGETIITLPAAQDHKPAHDGDTGPNTGGMGAYCPTPIVDEELMQRIESEVLVPIVHAMKRARRPFKGVLYAGLMLTAAGPKVLEFNVRFGDPECQPLLMRLKSDLVDILEATIDTRLAELEAPQWDPRPSICVVMASEGYPGDYAKGHAISGLDAADAVQDVKVFHAGTKIEDEQVVNSGGRVLGVTALGDTISVAKLQAYKAVKAIRWQGAWCRKDISDKALAENDQALESAEVHSDTTSCGRHRSRQRSGQALCAGTSRGRLSRRSCRSHGRKATADPRHGRGRGPARAGDSHRRRRGRLG